MNYSSIAVTSHGLCCTIHIVLMNTDLFIPSLLIPSPISLSFDKLFLIFQATDSDPLLIVAVLTPFTFKPFSVNLLLIICLHDPKT